MNSSDHGVGSSVEALLSPGRIIELHFNFGKPEESAVFFGKRHIDAVAILR